MGERLPGTDVFMESHRDGTEGPWLFWGRQPQNLHLTIQQSATEQALCARLDDAGDKTGKGDRYRPCLHGAYSNREDLDTCLQAQLERMHLCFVPL